VPLAITWHGEDAPTEPVLGKRTAEKANVAEAPDDTEAPTPSQGNQRGRKRRNRILEHWPPDWREEYEAWKPRRRYQSWEPAPRNQVWASTNPERGQEIRRYHETKTEASQP